jgi:hypothetical protein
MSFPKKTSACQKSVMVIKEKHRKVHDKMIVLKVLGVTATELSSVIGPRSQRVLRQNHTFSPARQSALHSTYKNKVAITKYN